MEPLVADWVALIVRWMHVVVGAAWIGTSFYFTWLNHAITPPEHPEPGVDGELWAIHGGGFYRLTAYPLGPGRVPGTLHWFKWEAYFTWITGVLLLALVYYLGTGSGALVASGAGLGRPAAVAIALGSLAAGWVLYDALCRTRLGTTGLPFAGLLLALGAAAAFGYSQVFTGRAAYIHVGALFGTLMAGNVFRVIIPSQRALVAAIAAGRAPDPALHRAAARRSLHNNYFTLPVLFIMVSNHYPLTYGQPAGWAVLAGLGVIGVAVRHWLNLRHRGRQAPWLLPAAAVALVALALVFRPDAAARHAAAAEDAPSFAAVRAVIMARCTPCHSSAPTYPGIPVAAAGIELDAPAQLRALAERIGIVAVQSETMPLGNLTAMTPEERVLLGRWIAAGAPLR